MIIVITGPTCMGKSETALEVAKTFKAEIINGDAFQCYKEMDIGVAKPPKEYFDLVPHHLYSFVDVDHDYSIAEYQLNLRKKIEELQSIIKTTKAELSNATQDNNSKQQEIMILFQIIIWKNLRQTISIKVKIIIWKIL